jgi:hypothetical protein
MALIAANRLTVTIPTGPDDPPADEVAQERIGRWLEGEYGYRPPVESLEGQGWSAAWEIGGRLSPGWRYDAVIPRHLGPSRDEVARARHPAGSSAPASSSRPSRPRRPDTRKTSPELERAITDIQSLFDADLGR